MTVAPHILVVDDVEKNVKLLADVLAVKGFRVSTAFSGEQALARIAGETPDLVLLDVMMPGTIGRTPMAGSARIARHTS